VFIAAGQYRRPALLHCESLILLNDIHLIAKRCGHIEYRHRGSDLLHSPAAPQQKRKTRNQTMTAFLMKTFDRAALSFFLLLAATPVLALVAAGSIH
jgi:hypothetical protein